ncbi:threonine transporter RhtB [Alteromonas sp. KUL42]|uniref:EamA family transporter n=1 Tax=Alteromonas sp. KUL42 TaxID=2480797 RepID=UPI001036E492|nr:DMT family transporter [Alteromonas sp. KUL42]TAP38120.1 DMT family transporter [Alteromonas sp. KUL42]GEA05325.1 threonine transporter RhtB [Alteromonas sp. KUL42]
MNKRFLSAIVSVLLAMVAIQSGASFAKQLFPIAGPEGTSALRAFFAAAILSIIFKPWKARLSPRGWRNVIFYGLCLGAMNIIFYLAIARIPLGIGVALEFTGPLAVAFFSARKKRDFAWVLLAVVGVCLLLPDIGTSPDSLDPVGVMLALTAGAFWAGYIVFGNKTGSEGSGGVTVTLGMLVAAFAIVPIGVISQGEVLLTPFALFMGVAVGVFSSAIPYTLEMNAMRNMPKQTFSIMMSVEPAIAAIAAFIIIDETLTVSQWFAVALVVVATAGSSITQRQKQVETLS